MNLPKGLTEAITKAVGANRLDEVCVEKAGLTPPKEEKRLKKLASACGSEVNWAKQCKTLGLAHWMGMVEAECRGDVFYYGILAVDRFGSRTLYAVPARSSDTIAALPECAMNESDLRLLIDLAEQISTDWRKKVVAGIEVDGMDAAPRKERLAYEEDAIIALFQNVPELIVPFIAMLDEQFRIGLKRNLGAASVYNFIVTDEESTAWVERTLSAMLLTGCFGTEKLNGADTIELCKTDRALLFCAQDDTAVEKLSRALDEWAQRRIDCPAETEPIKTLPIVISSAAVDATRAVNIPVAKLHHEMTKAEVSLLKRVMAHCLTSDFYDEVYGAWQCEQVSERADLWSSAELWRQILTYFVTSRICPETCERLDSVFAEAYGMLWRPEEGN